MSAWRPPHLADRVDVESWAERIESRALLPSLVRRLVRQTNDQVTRLEMRAAEGVGLPGYDGQVEAARGTPFVPVGSSVWELGTGRDPRDKANEDYRDRTANPLGVDTSATTFVFVTPREWRDKNDWADDKRAQGVWADVVALDVDDIMTAFESGPAAHYWFSELVGKPVDGVQTLEAWWDAFSRVSLPALTSELVLAGRANEADALLRILREETRITSISSASIDDGLAFVAGALTSSGPSPQTDLLDRSLVVYDGVALRRLQNTSELLILLPYEEELSRQARLLHAHHVVLLGTRDVPADIDLPGVDRDTFAAGLQAQGLSESDARRYARAAHRSLIAFQNDSPARGVSVRNWAPAFASHVVRRALLAGGWNEARSGDLDALSALFGVTYDAARDELERLALVDDPIFTSVGGVWGLTSPEAAWRFALQQMTLQDLVVAEEAAQTVLGAVDPALQLPIDQRWAATIYGNTPIHSTDLRRGIASALAACGALGAATRVGGGGSVSDWASGVVASLLRRANEDDAAQLWTSLSDVLPLLAEAAPEMFVRAVQHGTTP